jgi:Serine dehydratase alpha chain
VTPDLDEGPIIEQDVIRVDHTLPPERLAEAGRDVEAQVQVPCIERNAVASITAINAARIALRGDGRHFVLLDKAINTMRMTGRDMLDKYKETSRGGLAVNVIEC